MTSPRVSVIIPSLDMGRYIDAAFGSIARQEISAHEVMLVDSGSTDETFEVAARWRDAGLPIRVLHDEPCGPGPARNRGIEAAEGDVIAFLDPDDLWPAGKLQRQLARLSRTPEVDMVSGYVRYFDQADPTGLEPAADSRTSTIFHVHLGCCLYRRRALDGIGLFDPDFMYSEDVDLLLRMRESDRPFTILRSVELYYRIHPVSMMKREDPRKTSDFRLATIKSLQRRRDAGRAHLDLPPFASFLEPEGG